MCASVPLLPNVTSRWRTLVLAPQPSRPSSLYADGHGQKHLNCLFSGPGAKALQAEGASGEGSFANVAMNGQEVFKFAVKAVPSVRLWCQTGTACN